MDKVLYTGEERAINPGHAWDRTRPLQSEAGLCAQLEGPEEDSSRPGAFGVIHGRRGSGGGIDGSLGLSPVLTLGARDAFPSGLSSQT